MEVNRRTQSERSAATRDAVLDAARRLFAERGYAAVGTPEIARAAGVSRGAMYHQFASKLTLFASVVEVVEAEVTAQLSAQAGAAGADPIAVLHGGIDAWMLACETREIRQILLVDAPVVLGWEGCRDLAQEYGLGLMEQLLQAAIDAGQLPPFAPRPFAHVLLGALQEAAFVITAEPDRRDEVARVIHAIVDGLHEVAARQGA